MFLRLGWKSRYNYKMIWSYFQMFLWDSTGRKRFVMVFKYYLLKNPVLRTVMTFEKENHKWLSFDLTLFWVIFFDQKEGKLLKTNYCFVHSRGHFISKDPFYPNFISRFLLPNIGIWPFNLLGIAWRSFLCYSW